MASANFTVNGSACPPEKAVAYGSTVSLALLSTAFNTADWSIVGLSDETLSAPTISTAGSPRGATATFTMGADPGDGLGISYLVQCKINGGRNAAGQEDSALVKRAVVGVSNIFGLVPLSTGETTERSSLSGWTRAINHALAAGGLMPSLLSLYATSNEPILAVAAEPGWYVVGSFVVPVNATIRLDVTGIVSDSSLTMTTRMYCVTSGSVGEVTGSRVVLTSTVDDQDYSSSFAVVGGHLYQIQSQVVGNGGDAYFGYVRRAAPANI